MIKEKSAISKAIDSKWDKVHEAVCTIENARNDLFDNVALALSRIEGKLVFLNSDDTLDGKPRVTEGHSQKVAKQVQQEVADTRKALDKIFVQLTNGRDSLFSS